MTPDTTLAVVVLFRIALMPGQSLAVRNGLPVAE
jgi:hypothetical protein